VSKAFWEGLFLSPKRARKGLCIAFLTLAAILPILMKLISGNGQDCRHHDHDHHDHYYNYYHYYQYDYYHHYHCYHHHHHHHHYHYYHFHHYHITFLAMINSRFLHCYFHYHCRWKNSASASKEPAFEKPSSSTIQN